MRSCSHQVMGGAASALQALVPPHRDKMPQQRPVPAEARMSARPVRCSSEGTRRDDAAQGEGDTVWARTSTPHTHSAFSFLMGKRRIVGICQGKAEVLTTDQGPVGAARLLR